MTLGGSQSPLALVLAIRCAHLNFRNVIVETILAPAHLGQLDASPE